MRHAGIVGEILPWRDLLHEGPVPAGLSLGAMSEGRARFIAECGWATPEDALAQFQARDSRLSDFHTSSQINFSAPSDFHQAGIAGPKGLFTELAAKMVVLLGNNRKKGR